MQVSGQEGYTTDEGLAVNQRRVRERTEALRHQIDEDTALADDVRSRHLEELAAIEQSVQEVLGFVSAAGQASYKRSIQALHASLK